MSYPNVLKIALLAAATIPFLVACGGGVQPTTESVIPLQDGSNRITLTGGGVKGPLAFAEVALYRLDSTQPNFFDIDQALATAKTDAYASIQDLTIARDYPAPIVMVVNGTKAIDVNTGRAPTLNLLLTVVTPDMLRRGTPIYATPLTTMAFYMARHRVPSGASDDEFVTALNEAATQIKNNIGVTLPATLDIFRDPPVMNNSATTPDAQQAVAAHRAALEAVAAVLYQMQPDTSTETQTRNILLDALALDLQSDGMIDGAKHGIALKGLNAAILSSDPNSLSIPHTEILLADIASLIKKDLNSLATNVKIDESLMTIKLAAKIFSGLDNTITNVTQPIRLLWDFDSNNVLGYLIFVGATPETATQQIADLAVSASTFDPLAPSFDFDSKNFLSSNTSKQICFRIKAYNEFGSSEYSEPACSAL